MTNRPQSSPIPSSPVPLTCNSLLDTLSFSFSFVAGKSQCLTEAFLCGLPFHHPQDPSLPLLSLLCERGAKRQVLAGGHFLLPKCWTKTHPAAWHSWEVSRVEASGIGVQARASWVFLLTHQPFVFWWQGPWGS